jgi:hypothetical protein
VGWLDGTLLSTSAGSSFSFSFDFGGWWLLVPFVGLTAFLVAIQLIHSSIRQETAASSDFKLETDLQQAIARSKDGQWASTWKAPMLPASVIASIWTGRFLSSTPPVGSNRNQGSSPRWFTWNYRREAPYIVAAAFLSLRDAGLIRMFLEPGGRLVGTFHQVRVERTDLDVSVAEMPMIEGGLLQACEAFLGKRFSKTRTPSAMQVVIEWIHHSQNAPFQWVLDVAVEQSRALGLCGPGIKNRRRGAKPIYSIEHLAACDDQVVACVSRWRAFATFEPDIQQRLLTEVAFGIRGRTTSY